MPDEAYNPKRLAREDFLAFQKAMFEATIRQDAENRHFGNHYTTLNEFNSIMVPLANKHGFIVRRDSLTAADGNAKVFWTTMEHVETGEQFTATITLPLAKNDAQGVGSCMTYGGRYTSQMVSGRVSDPDDDAEGAVNHGATKRTPAKKHDPTDLEGAIGPGAEATYLGRWEKMGVSQDRIAKGLAHFGVKRVRELSGEQVLTMDGTFIRETSNAKP